MSHYFGEIVTHDSGSRIKVLNGLFGQVEACLTALNLCKNFRWYLYQ